MKNKHFCTTPIFIYIELNSKKMYDRKKQNNPMWGKKQTEEAKASISATQKMRYKTLNEILRSVSKEQMKERIRLLVEEKLNELISTQTFKVK